jgi:hypothetical protein
MDSVLQLTPKQRGELFIAAAQQGVLAPVVTLETLLKMKRAAGRPQDLTDIEELQRAR